MPHFPPLFPEVGGGGGGGSGLQLTAALRLGFFSDFTLKFFVPRWFEQRNRTNCQTGFAEIPLIVWMKSDFTDIPARVIFCFRRVFP